MAQDKTDIIYRRQIRNGAWAGLLMSNKIRLILFLDSSFAFLFFYLGTRFGLMSHLERVQKENFLSAVLYAFSFALIALAMGLFEREKRFIRLQAIRAIFFSSLLALGASITLVHFVFFLSPGRYAMVYGWAASFVSISFFHWMAGHLVSQFHQNFVFLGQQSEVTRELMILVKNSKALLKRAHKEELSKKLQSIDSESIESDVLLLKKQEVTDVLLSHAPLNVNSRTLAFRLLQEGFRVVGEIDYFVEIARRYPRSALTEDWVSRAGIHFQKPFTNFLKRSSDIFASLASLILLSPLLLIISVLTKVSSPGPVFFVQIRLGRFSKPFRMYKFRTLTVNHSGDLISSASDQRITWLGKLIRPLHLDELPQIINILLGDMSFVGPRPEELGIATRYRNLSPVFNLRHSIRPGLTGHAQIHQGKTGDSEEEMLTKLGYDIYYIKNFGPVLDLYITLRTLSALGRSN